jgi:hypothetical protein
MTRSRYTLALVMLWGFSGIAVEAMTFVPMSVEDLTRSSVATVIGTVDSLNGFKSADGQIFTFVKVVVDRVVRGNLTAPVITLKEPGGTVGTAQEVLFGAPSFQAGEHVLLFLTVGADGSLRTNQLALGKFHVEVNAEGLPQAVQRLERGTTVLVVPGTSPLPSSIPMDDLLTEVKGAAPATDDAPAFQTEPPPSTAASAFQEFSEPFTLLGSPPARLFEVDEGQSISYLIDQTGDATLGLTASRQAVDDAFAAWTNVATASISLVDAGLTSDLTIPCRFGAHKILFNDPHGKIPNPKNCTGVLGVGGFCTKGFEKKVFNGTTFNRAVAATLTLADGWGACPVWTQCNVAEVATHEVGHSIGMGHSADADATMYFQAHFDGRCADVRTDDINGITFIYPTTMPPTIATASPLPEGAVLVPYSQPLSATGGTGGFTWSQVSGSLPIPGLSLSGAAISGTPSFTGLGIFVVKATDGNGDSHTKELDVTVGPHDSVVLPVKPLTVTLASGKLSVSKPVKVTVRNADADFLGHKIQLSASSADCPGGTIAGLPDFKTTPGPQDSVLVASGKSKTATVPLVISSAAFATFNHKAPTRCTITFTASTFEAPGNVDPNPSNDAVTMELNVIDKNDPEMSAVHESVIKSLAPVTVTLKDLMTTKTKNVAPAVVNADILPPETLGHSITVSLSDGDCPSGTVGVVDMDTKTVGVQNPVTVKGGSTKSGKLPLTINASNFLSPNIKSPARCTAQVSISGPGGDTDASNDVTELVIDVIDKNDF